MKKIIDVSHHNGVIDWAKVAKDDIAAVIIRAGYGKKNTTTCNTDRQFKANIAGAIKAGLPVGIYFFSYALTTKEAEEEATFCKNLIGSYKVTLPVYFDWEYDSMNYYKAKKGVYASKTLISDMTVAFCEKIKKYGFKPGVYYNKDYEKNHLDMSKFTKYSRWLAYYTSVKQTGVDIWQYSETGKVNGINSNAVDMDYLLNENLLPSKAPTAKEEYVKGLKQVLNKEFGTKLAVNATFDAALENVIKSHNVKLGSKNGLVKYYQTWFNKLKITDASNKALAEDGSFGAKTKEATIKAQKLMKLTADGEIGSGTAKGLLSLIK